VIVDILYASAARYLMIRLEFAYKGALLT